MKVLMISGDKNLLVPGTSAFGRLQLQKRHVEKMDVFGYTGVWSGPRGIFEVILAVLRCRYDVVTAQEPFWRGLLAWKIARLTGARLNVQVHADLSAESFIRQVLSQIVLRHADSIRVVSEKIKAYVIAHGARAPITVLPMYIDLTRFKSLQRHPASPPRILWVGRFEEEKNPFEALTVLSAVRAAGVDAHLIMLGEGSLKTKLKKASSNLPVEFPGWQDPIPYLAQTSLVLSTSRQESYGASIIEALAAGVPIVAPDVGIAREAGAIVVPREKLADAVLEVLKSGTTGSLKLSLPGAEEWAKRWKETLV